MQAGTAVTSSVLVPSAAVTINGVPRDLSDLSITREISTDLPGQVIGGGSVSAATGTATLIPDAPVGTIAPSPWSVTNRPPSAGDPCTVDLGLNGQTWRVLTGVVDASSGTFGGGSMSTQLVDGIDSLRRIVSFPVRPAGASGPETAMSRLAAVLAYGGFAVGAVPNDSTVVYLPLVGGSIAPSIGVDSLLTWGNTGGAPYTWGTTAWGQGVRFTGQFPGWDAPTPVVGKTSIEWCVDVDCSTTGRGVTFYLTMKPTGMASQSTSVRVSVPYNGTTYAQIGSQADITIPVPSHKQVRLVVRQTITNDNVRTRCWFFDPRTGANLSTPNYDSTSTITGIAGKSITPGVTLGGVGPDAASFAGVCINAFTDASAPLPTTGANLFMNFWSDTDTCPLAAAPAITKRVALEVAQEIASAILASLWLDEYGRLQVWGRDALAYRTETLTLTSRAHLLELGWNTDASGVAHTVTVNRETPTVNMAPASAPQGQTIYVAPDIMVRPGETYSEVIHPDENTDWISPDIYPTFTWALSQNEITYRDGTWVGRSDEDGTTTTGSFVSSITKLDDRSLAYRITAAKSNTTPISNRIDDTFSAAAFRGTPTPIIRAKGTVTWSPSTETTSGTIVGRNTGPNWAPDITHDGGRWLQVVDGLDFGAVVADWLSDRLSKTTPTIDNLDILPDLRLQLGDVVRVVDDLNSGAEITGTVGGISLGLSGGVLTQSITLRVRSVTMPSVTLGDMDATYSGQNLAALDAAEPTYQTMDSSPLTAG